MSAAAERIKVDSASGSIYRDAPSWDGSRTAALGGFRCDTVASGRALLARAAERLSGEGFESLIGPMDGDTWHSYRLVAESDGSPPFVLEPTSAAHDLEAFTAAGFAPISSYVSSRAALDDAIGAGAPVRVEDVTVGAWDGREADALVDMLFDMSVATFAARAFFKPIAREAFRSLYAPVLPLVDPRLVLFARNAQGVLLGFLFGLPDRLQGERPTTAILKTYASARPGVGHLLADTFHRAARDLGYTEVIHALMHVENVSLARSRRHAGRIFRRYALMGRRL